MRKLYGFTTLILIGIYIFFLYSDNRRIFTYITERYYYVILGTGMVLALFGILGITYLIKSKRIKKELVFIKNIISDKKFLVMLVLLALGLNLSPLFIFIAGVIVLVPFKDSSIDNLLKLNILKPTLLILILFTGILLPSNQISSATAFQRIGNLNTVNISSDKKSLNNFNNTSESYDIGDWVLSLSYNPDLDFYVGKKVDVTGFIFAPNTIPEETFIVSRFVIRCCAADATPVGLKVKYDWKSNFKTDDWVRVTGKFELIKIDEIDELIIIPENVVSTEVPDRPYIS